MYSPAAQDVNRFLIQTLSAKFDLFLLEQDKGKDSQRDREDVEKTNHKVREIFETTKLTFSKASVALKDLSDSDIDRLTAFEKETMITPLLKLTDEVAGSTKEDVEQILKPTFDKIHRFLKCQMRFEAEGILPFLDQDWARDFFIDKVESGDKGALQFLFEISRDSSTTGNLVKLVKQIICANEGKNFSALLQALLTLAGSSEKDCLLVRPAVIEVLANFMPPKYLESPEPSFVKLLAESEWVLDPLLEGSRNKENWSLGLLGCMMNSLPRENALTFFKLLKKRGCDGDVHCQHLCVAFAAHDQLAQFVDFRNATEYKGTFTKYLETIDVVAERIAESKTLEKGASYLWMSLYFSAKKTAYKDPESCTAKDWLMYADEIVLGLCPILYGRFLNTKKGDSVSFSLYYRLLAVESEFSFIDYFLRQEVATVEPSPVTPDFFPTAETVFVGSLQDDIADEMASFFQPHGIDVCKPQPHSLLRTDKKSSHVKDLYQECPNFSERWVRDYVSFGVDSKGHVKLKLPNTNFSYNHCSKFFRAAREKRFKEKVGTSESSHPMGYQLGALITSEQKMVASLFFEMGYAKDISMNFSSAEQGNMRFGKNEDGSPFLIVGHDTVEISRYIIQEKLERYSIQYKDGKWLITSRHRKARSHDKDSVVHVDDQVVLRVFERDYGIPCESIYLVEQPGSFHLDMGLAVVGFRTILLNDSAKAFEMGLEHFKEIAELSTVDDKVQRKIDEARKAAQVLKQIEDEAEKELIKQEFQVIRMPGQFCNIFEEDPELHQINLFNFITAKTPKKDSHFLVYSPGAPKRFRDLLVSQLESHCPYDIKEIGFLNERATRELLAYGGAINCATQLLERPLDFKGADSK